MFLKEMKDFFDRINRAISIYRSLSLTGFGKRMESLGSVLFICKQMFVIKENVTTFAPLIYK